MDPLAWARSTYRQRRIRDKQMGEDLFGEPSWDILLDLFIAHLENRVVRLGAIGGTNTISATTILRRADVLEQRGLIQRKLCPHDGRRVDITLSEQGIVAMYRLYSESNNLS